VPSAAKYPVTALSLGKDEDRNRLMLGIGAAVGCVLSVFVMVVLASVFGDSPSSRLKAKDLLRRCDFLFRAAHYYRPHFPIARYRTVLGGFLTVLVVLTLTSSLLFFVFQSAVIDRLSVQFKEIPGRLVFNPSHVNLTFQLFAVGIDTETLPCHAICESEGNLEVSQGSGWRFECRNASVHRACLIQGYFDSTVEREGGPLADASRLHLRIEQAALHSWQTVVSSRFRRDGQDYLSSSNLTAPPGAVFAGASPSLLTFRMRPTVYEHASGQRDQGYVPFLVSAQLGDTVLASPNASDPQAHYFRSVFGSGVSLDIRLDVERHTNWFFEVPQFPILAIFSTVTAVVSGLIRFCKLIVTAWEFYKLRKTKSQRRAQVSHLGHLSAQQRIARNILAGVCGEEEHEEGAAHDDADVDSDKGHGGGHGHGNSGGGGHGHGGKATQSQGDKSQIRPSDWAGFKERPRSRSQSSHATSHSSASERKARRGNNSHHGNGVGVVGVEPEKPRLAWEDPMAGEETVAVSGIGVERQSNGNGHGAASEAPAGSEWESASTPLVGLGIERVTEDGSHASVEQVHVKVPIGVVHAGTLDGEDSSGMLYVDEHSETMSVGWEGDLEMSEMGVWAYM